MIDETINLCFITDERYVLPTAVAIESLKVNKSPTAKYRVHVICRAVSDEGMRQLSAVSAPGVEVVIHPNVRLPVDESRIQLVRHVSTAAIFKFFLADLFPELDKIIYLDSDILIQRDLTALWQVPIRRYYAAVVKDNQSVIGWERHLKWLEFKESAYFNSGVMLLNLALMRKNGLAQKLLDYRINGKNRFMDQDALNVVFGCRVKYVSYRFNCLNWLFITCTIPQLKELFGPEIRDTVEENLDNAVVLHIGGSEKPWLCDVPYYTGLYRRYADRIGWHFTFPKVSVIVPVYNAERHLRQCLDSIRNQTLKDVDIICVDNGSTDKSMSILEEYAQADGRIRLYKEGRSGAGRCRNIGIAHAHGEYVGFVDADDFVERDFYSKLYGRAVKDGVDVCMTARVRECDEKGNDGRWKNLGVNGMTVVRSIRERGGMILSSGVTWNKIYRRSFLLEHKLHYAEMPCAGEDKPFGYGVLFHANQIAVIWSSVYHYRQSNDSASFRLKGRESFAIVDFYREVGDLLRAADMSEDDRKAWNDIVRRGRDAEFAMFARRMQPGLVQEFKCKCVEEFFDDTQNIKTIGNLIVSLTTYPKRIGLVHHTVKSILGQSIRPREVVLWLTESEFPGRESALPSSLTDLVKFGLKIRWCEAIRSYQKLIPSLRQYPEDVIVTADDDLIYTRYWLEKLWKTHLDDPTCIVFHRGRFIKPGKPYNDWGIITHAQTPSEACLTLPTGCGGVLYPSHCFKKEIFNQAAFLKFAPMADDLWFWAMAMFSGVRYRQVFAYENVLNVMAGSQVTSLSEDNVGSGKNDWQFKAILKHYPSVRRMLVRVRLAQLAERASSDLLFLLFSAPGKIVKSLLPYSVVVGLCRLSSRGTDGSKEGLSAENARLKKALEVALAEVRVQESARVKNWNERMEFSRKAREHQTARVKNWNERMEFAQQLKEAKAEIKRLKGDGGGSTPVAEKAEIARLKAEIARIKSSKSYKIGRFLAWPVRKIRRTVSGKS